MFLVRPVEVSDIPALETLAAVAVQTAPGAHTLPGSRQAVERSVEHSLASFAAQPTAPEDEAYGFVLEADDGSVVGSATILATAGANGAFFTFRKDAIQQVSRDLNISHDVQVLTLCSDLSSWSQLSGFHLYPQHRSQQEAALLSRARLLFAAAAPQRFSDRFFASLSGCTDDSGHSPFWEAIGRKFFQMDFVAAERLIEGARNRTLIVELMPHYPVYVPLLPPAAQAVMAKAHSASERPLALLTAEGFKPEKFIDIFDGGPILCAHKRSLRSFSSTARRELTSEPADEGVALRMCLIATRRQENFRAVLAPCVRPKRSDSVFLSDPIRRRLDVADGDAILCVEL